MTNLLFCAISCNLAETDGAGNSSGTSSSAHNLRSC